MDLNGMAMDPWSEPPLYGFGGTPVPVIGTISLPLIVGTSPCKTTVNVKFHIIRAPSVYNAILRRTTLTALKAIASIPHLKMKFPTTNGIGEMRGDQRTARVLYLDELKKIPRRNRTTNRTKQDVHDGRGNRNGNLRRELH